MMSSRRAPSRRLPRWTTTTTTTTMTSTSAAHRPGRRRDPPRLRPRPRARRVDHRALPLHLDRVWLPLGADAGVARGRRRRIRAANVAPGARARRRGARQARRDVAHATLGVGRRGVGIVGGDPWARWRCYPNRARRGRMRERASRSGLAASVAARLADAAINGVNAEVDGGPGAARWRCSTQLAAELATIRSPFSRSSSPRARSRRCSRSSSSAGSRFPRAIVRWGTRGCP